MPHLLCFPFERSGPFTDPITPISSYLHSLLQRDVTISAMALAA